MRDVISDIEEVTPEWLTGVLRENGFLPQGQVTGIKNILAKTFLLSIVFRLEISYSDDATAAFAPLKIFLKTSRPDLPPELGSEINRKEVEFYHTIQALMPDAHFIRCYDAAYSEESGGMHLLLDDLSDTHFQTDVPQLPSKEDCELAVDCLASLHASWFEHPRLGMDVGQLLSEPELQDFVHGVEKSVVRFLDFMGDKLSAGQRGIYESLLASSYLPWKHLTDARGLTLIHGDAHCWNFLYPRDAGRERVRIFDWSLWHLDLGARDLAFMMALGWDKERRAAMESHLLKLYFCL